MNSSQSLSFCLFSLALVAATPIARSQDQPPPPSGPPAAAPSDNAPPPPENAPKKGWGHRPNMIKAILGKVTGLTADEQQQIQAIQSDMREQGKAIREDDSLSDEDKRDKMMQLGKDALDKVRAVLTPAQQTQFDAARADLMKHARKHANDGGGESSPPPPPPPPPPAPAGPSS